MAKSRIVEMCTYKSSQMKLILCVALLAFAVSSCKCHEEGCQPGGVIVEVVGFDSSELKNIVMHKYDAQGFTNLIQTIPNTQVIVDTSNGTPHTILALGPQGGFNWDIEFPVISKTVRIYNLTYDQQTQKVCDFPGDKRDICTSPLTSYTMDGIVYPITPGQSRYFAYITIQR